jgi:hypothetical protein
MRMGCDETCLYCFPILLSAGFPFPALGISGSGLLAVFEKSKKNLNLKKTFLGDRTVHGTAAYLRKRIGRSTTPFVEMMISFNPNGGFNQ